MIRFILFSFLLFAAIQVEAQQGRQLQFREDTYDFGLIAEENGPVTHEFVFTNNSERPVTIVNVQPSCGCTTPGWSREPVPPGQSGYITARFDPKDRPGAFLKTLTVTTDLEGTPVILQIKGQVLSSGSEATDASGFIASSGSLRLKSRTFNVGKVLLKDEYLFREFQVINSGEAPITFDQAVIAPKHIRVEFQPSTLNPGTRGVIRIGYNGKLRNQYGFQSDNIEVRTNDNAEAVKSFSVVATIEDYFPQMTPEELEKAPMLRLSQYDVDLGRIDARSIVSREIPVTNSGRANLEIRFLQPNCSCLSASVTKKTLKPGETATLRVSFDPGSRKGSTTKAVTLYANDPRNPVQRITFSAYIEQ